MPRQRIVTYSHWSASLANRLLYTLPREEALRERQQWRAAYPFLRERLERAGIPAATYFRFRDGDATGEAAALAQAEALAAHAWEATGVRLTIAEVLFI